jgi:lipopolysaccharide assembly protein A
MILVAVILVAAIWFIVVNRARIDVNLWVPRVTAPLWLVLLVTFVGGMVVGLLLRRRRRSEHR